MEQQDAQIDKKPFKGYTIDELRYHRAMTLARCEVAKTHAMDSLSAVGGSIVNDQTAKRNVFGRIVQGIDDGISGVEKNIKNTAAPASRKRVKWLTS